MKTILLSGLLSVILLTGCKDMPVPDLSSLSIGNIDIAKGLNFGKSVYNASKEITPEQEYYIGRSVSVSILEKYKVYDNKNITNYVNSIGKLLTMHSPTPEVFGGYHFVVLESDEINAFAAPGGFIFITKSLLKLCTNEDELASVLAHEIAHVQLKHGVKSIKDSRWTSVATMLGKEVASQHIDGDLLKLTNYFNKSIDDVVNTLVVNGYSKSYEHEADKYAQNILTQTGYANTALVSMLNKMDTKLESDTRGFGSTHPKASQRVDYINGLNTPHSNQIATVRTKRFIHYIKNV